jgi:NADH:ubiquinone oxidoreductase subunit 5 (subunit L)/multisubunit Na+/H+ antiporter MnhA subunit
MSRDSYYPFYGWLLIVGVILFGSYLLWDYGLFHHLIEKDITYISSIILILFIFINLYLGIASWRLSKQIYFTHKPDKTNSNSLASEYLQLINWGRKHTSNESESILARLVEKIHRGHSTGWFFSDILMRLGLIGTVIGFVLMLSTVYQLKDNDVQALQQLLATMGSGMQVALYTTLAGLGTAMLISIQCQWLDYCADGLVSKIIKLGINDNASDKTI